MSQIFKDFFSADELANLKGVSLKTVYSWVSRGIAPPHEKVAGMYWFYKKSANEYRVPKRGRPPN